jgi:hypothetical protein
MNACRLQEIIMKEAEQTIEGEANKHLANLAKSFATLETLKLRMRMKPAPKAIDTEKLAAAKRSKVHVVAPSED